MSFFTRISHRSPTTDAPSRDFNSGEQLNDLKKGRSSKVSKVAKPARIDTNIPVLSPSLSQFPASPAGSYLSPLPSPALSVKSTFSTSSHSSSQSLKSITDAPIPPLPSNLVFRELDRYPRIHNISVNDHPPRHAQSHPPRRSSVKSANRPPRLRISKTNAQFPLLSPIGTPPLALEHSNALHSIQDIPPSLASQGYYSESSTLSTPDYSATFPQSSHEIGPDVPHTCPLSETSKSESAVQNSDILSSSSVPSISEIALTASANKATEIKDIPEMVAETETDMRDDGSHYSEFEVTQVST